MMMAEDVPAATQAAPEGGAPAGESVAGAPSPISGDTTANTSGLGTGAPTPDSSSSATATLSTAAVPATSSNLSPPAPTTAASSSATADAAPADAAGIPPTTSPALDPALGQIPAPAAEPVAAAPAEPAAAPVSPVMFEIYGASPYLRPIRIYADGHIDGLPDGYQVTINRSHALAAELASLKADDRHLSLLASWHREMEVLGRGLSGEVTRLLGETKKYLEDVL
ncbi:hypothetical protein [Burkholderia glumae]